MPTVYRRSVVSVTDAGGWESYYYYIFIIYNNNYYYYYHNLLHSFKAPEVSQLKVDATQAPSVKR